MELGVRYGKEPREFFLTNRGENYGVKYGDLTGDGKEEAAVVLAIITSGSGRGNLVFIYTMLHGKPTRLAVFETGDRWDFGYHRAYIEDGQLLIERYKPKIVEDRGENHNMSRSDSYLRDYYKWSGSEFKKIKTEEVPADPHDDNPWVIHGNP